jgi:hypothetical protein
MEDKYERGILRISAVFVIAAALIIPLVYVGIGPNPVLLLVYGAIAAGLYVAWQRADAYSMYVSGLWLGPVIAAVTVVVGIVLGTTPAEFQALGGIVGIIGVINLLLRPVYRLLNYVVSNAIQIGREIQEERSS